MFTSYRLLKKNFTAHRLIKKSCTAHRFFDPFKVNETMFSCHSGIMIIRHRNINSITWKFMLFIAAPIYNNMYNVERVFGIHIYFDFPPEKTCPCPDFLTSSSIV